jgi:hypothetical protein
MFSTTKLRPLNVFSWKVGQQLVEECDVHVETAAVVLRAKLEGIDRLRLELQCFEIRLWKNSAASARSQQSRPIEIEAAGFVAPRIACVGKQLRVGL